LREPPVGYFQDERCGLGRVSAGHCFTPSLRATGKWCTHCDTVRATFFSVDRAEDGAVVRDGPHGRVQGRDGRGAEVLPGLVHAVAGGHRRGLPLGGLERCD
jgi:hypothetical protein